MQFFKIYQIPKHDRLKSTYFGEKSKLRFEHLQKNGIIFKTWRQNSFFDIDFIESNAMFCVILLFYYYYYHTDGYQVISNSTIFNNFMIVIK